MPPKRRGALGGAEAQRFVDSRGVAARLGHDDEHPCSELGDSELGRMMEEGGAQPLPAKRTGGLDGLESRHAVADEDPEIGGELSVDEGANPSAEPALNQPAVA